MWHSIIDFIQWLAILSLYIAVVNLQLRKKDKED